MNINQTTLTIEKAWQDYHRGLLAFIRTKVGVLEDAEDILNDVFSALIKTTDVNDAPDNIASWLYRVTRNKIVDYYRVKGKFEQLPDELVSANEDVNVIEQLAVCMLPMINVLPESYQRPLILSEIEGKKYKEVATELNLTLSAVKSRILRGREKLQKSMIACCNFYRDGAGNIMGYEQKGTHACRDCDK
ncbi:RNA polymerase sigma factor SigZ [Thalassotalea insulae]|uniref:RNA polymerase sigma factor SigZ n=1 Tax=Thalassotalea insulae TaxID=2056778 RepID=A0ABQ6GYX9_9GAMM|nr:sigma-70 family RNA polymerase sigma factor [Thalassotalea insulae]GLX80524.1 RNA polymerase sigma factor SigZ [Thalassotalea insulae]